MEFYEAKTVKTRKSHRCDYCHRDFPPGTTMEYESGLDESGFFVGYTCPDCVKYTPGFWKWCGYECEDVVGMFSEYLQEIGADHPAFKEAD